MLSEGARFLEKKISRIYSFIEFSSFILCVFFLIKARRILELHMTGEVGFDLFSEKSEFYSDAIIAFFLLYTTAFIAKKVHVHKIRKNEKDK